MTGHVDTVRSLLDKPGIDIDEKTAEGHTALDIGCLNGHLEVAKLLVAAGARVNPQASDEAGALLSAAYGGQLEVVKYLVEEAGADVRSTDHIGTTALIWGAHGGHVEVVDYLLCSQDIDIHAQTAEGSTALAVACINGHLEVAK
jgi:ankyrin repeat protein